MRTGQRFGWWASAAVSVLALAAAVEHAAAEGPAKLQSQRYLLAEPTSYTSVLDAFDGTALPDVRVALAFRRTHTQAMLGRERPSSSERIGGFYREVAQSTQVTNALALELATGLYRDLMAFVRLPLVLSDKRALSQPSGAPASAPLTEAVDAAAAGSNGQPALFGHNFRSATRSGIPGLDLGFAWGITNQYRTAYLPTWVVGVESRFGLGELLQACEAGDGCSAGINRGTVTLALDSRWSYRHVWLEPYLGLRYVREWATSARSRLTPSRVPGDLDTGMPSVEELTLGAALLAWEDRARFQRISIDLRGRAAYVTGGRDYSALFDVLGSSASPQLMAAGGGLLPFYGLTQVQGHARFSAQLAVAAQAAQYIRFRLGVSLSHVTTHLLTGAPACTTSAAGPCSPGQENPLYRAAIDLPGQRFVMLGNLGYDLFASALGQF